MLWVNPWRLITNHENQFHRISAAPMYLMYRPVEAIIQRFTIAACGIECSKLALEEIHIRCEIPNLRRIVAVFVGNQRITHINRIGERINLLRNIENIVGYCRDFIIHTASRINQEEQIKLIK